MSPFRLLFHLQLIGVIAQKPFQRNISLFFCDSFSTSTVFFVSDRLVECTALKRAIEVVYSATLPKASKPFIYMTIQLPHEHVDVNIHPTKREVKQ